MAELGKGVLDWTEKALKILAKGGVVSGRTMGKLANATLDHILHIKPPKGSY